MRVRFMPGLSSGVEMSDSTDKPIEHVLLHLPSSLTKTRRSCACVPGLLEAERNLRHGAMAESLEDLLRTLYTKSYVNRFKIKNITGVVARTRMQHSLQHLGWRVKAAANVYRRHHAARLTLSAPGDKAWMDTYCELRQEDVRAFNKRARTQQEVAERQRLRELAKELRQHAQAAAAASTSAGTGNAASDTEDEEEVEDHGGINVSGVTPGAGSMKQA
jgi:hypothetical protein